MVVLMVVAACCGIAQLSVLSLGTRTLRFSSLLLAVVTGCYGCGVLAVGLQLVYTRLLQSSTGQPLSEIVQTASCTVDPIIEELVKLLPLLAVVILARKLRRQWGYADYLLAGAAVGAGFSLAEALLRYGGQASRGISDGHGGFVLLTGLNPPHVLGIAASLTRWLPPPVDTLHLFGGGGGDVNNHLVWTALAGLGLGVLMRARGPRRLLGLVPLAYVSVDHAVLNYGLVHPGGDGLGVLLLQVLEVLRPGLPALVLLALVAAWVRPLPKSLTTLGTYLIRYISQTPADPR